MRTNKTDRQGGIGMMQQTKTWIILYAVGIALLALSLCQSYGEKPAGTPPQPGAVVQMPSDVMRP